MKIAHLRIVQNSTSRPTQCKNYFSARLAMGVLCSLAALAHAETCCTLNTQITIPTAYEYPLHQNVVPALLNPSSSAVGRGISEPELNNIVPGWNGIGGYRIEFTPTLPTAPATLNTTLSGTFSNQIIGNLPGSSSGTYQVFQSGTDGIGVILRVAADMDTDGFGTATGYAVNSAATRQIYRNSGGWTLATVYRADVGVQAALVKIPRTSYTPSSNSNINRTITLGKFNIYKRDGLIGSQRPGTLEIPLQLTFTIDLRPKTCVLSSAANQTIDLGTVRVNEFPTVGSTVQKNSNSATFSLICPADYAITVKAVASDSNNPANTNSNILSLGSGSTASGVGVQLLRNNSPVPLGSDSPAPLLAGDNRQWLVGSGVDQPTTTFTARYIRTGSVTPGTVQAQAGITFSYQ